VGTVCDNSADLAFCGDAADMDFPAMAGVITSVAFITGAGNAVRHKSMKVEYDGE
jgi:hypothetical protein